MYPQLYKLTDVRVFYFLSGLLFFINQVGQFYFDSWPLIMRNYLDPFLSIPVFMGIQRLFFFVFKLPFPFKVSNFKFWILLVVAFSVVFEIVFPIWNADLYSDVWDVVFYGFGAILCFLFERKSLPKEA